MLRATDQGVLWLVLWTFNYFSGANPENKPSLLDLVLPQCRSTRFVTPMQTFTKEGQAYIADCIIKSVPQTQFNIRIFYQSSTRCELMTSLSITRLRCLISTFMTRLLSPGNPRETILFGGPDPKRSSTLGSRKSDISMMSKEQSILTALSGSGVAAKSPVTQRLKVRVPLFHVYASL